MSLIKKKFRKLEKNVTLDSLCGNYYLGDDMSAIKNIYSMKIL